ncbi:MAG TPA: PKD domain-containing protein, partial [Thermoanaerobaculia bacterium]|nr:PKD domain-containing protein [Thermoanaerobaculia bacterium]
YTSAKISYTYAGVESGTPSGLGSPNGVNEVLFNDPLNEIAGSWNPATGGVVGQGGFNGVSGSRSWTSPFTADATHTQKTYSAWNITEGNLTIQDNVSSATGISSTRLAEIVAHEFGHTLGLGHSTDNTALMYPSVTGLGPSLRADDQLAARWLYPNGSQTPPPTTTVPNAPSNLAANISGSNVVLNWNDNASDETGESVYVSSNGGAYAKVTDLAASATTVTLSGFTTGSYSMYVIAFNAAGNSAPSNTVTVNFGATLQAAFNVNAVSGVAGQTTFSFTDQSTGSITSRLWVFGDTTTSSLQNPTHVYASVGQYTVTLTVNSGSASSSTSRTIFVSAATPQLAAAFTWSPSAPTTATDVTFADQSTGATGWQWNFGDGSSSTAQNPVKRYGAGSYNVTLTAFSGFQSSQTSHVVVVSNGAPVTPPVAAGFGWSPANPTTAQTVSFDDTTSGSPTSWSWSFGDGAGSNAQRPTHAYSNAGIYVVTLTTSNATSSSTIAHTIVVTQASFTTRSLVSASAQTNGIGGSVWRTELTLFNAGDATSIDLIFVPGNSGSMLTRTIFLGAKQSVTYANALLDIFGLSSGAGAIAIEATNTSSTPDIRTSSRTFTNGAFGTYGQAVPDVTTPDLDATMYLTALAANASYRTNIGLVNRSAVTGTANLVLYDANGAYVASASVPVAANSFQQSSLAAYFPAAASRSLDAASIVVTSSQPGAISVYASVIDNRTQDPIYIQALPLRSG